MPRKIDPRLAAAILDVLGKALRSEGYAKLYLEKIEQQYEAAQTAKPEVPEGMKLFCVQEQVEGSTFYRAWIVAKDQRDAQKILSDDPGGLNWFKDSEEVEGIENGLCDPETGIFLNSCGDTPLPKEIS